MLVNQYGYPLRRNPAFIPSGSNDLWDDVPGMSFLLDASKSASYSSGQTWANLVPAPADGSAQTAYDFYRGDTSSATTDDPTFNGTAGVAGAYWSYDAGDFHRLITSTVPPFIKSAHKTTSGNTAWYAFFGKIPSNGTNQALISSIGSTTPTIHGLELLISNSAGSNNFIFSARHPSYNIWIAQSGAKTANIDFGLIAAWKRNGSTNEIQLYYNTRTPATQTPSTGGTSTTDAPSRLTIGARGDGTFKVANNSRCYGIAGGSDDINATMAGKIFDYFNASTGITFA